MSAKKELEAAIATCEADLQTLREELAAVQREELKTVRPLWDFRFEPVEADWFDKPRAGSGCALFRLVGTVLKRQDCIEAGHAPSALEGSMVYLVNMLNRKIVMSIGGGALFISNQTFQLREKQAEADFDSERVYSAMEQAIVKGGGDVTEAILAQRHFRWAR